MIKWTTPTIQISFDEGELTNYEEVFVTLQNEGYQQTIKAPTVEGDTVTIALEQIETSCFGKKTKLQVNVLFPNGIRAASQIFEVNFSDNLYQAKM